MYIILIIDSFRYDYCAKKWTKSAVPILWLWLFLVQLIYKAWLLVIWKAEQLNWRLIVRVRIMKRLITWKRPSRKLSLKITNTTYNGYQLNTQKSGSALENESLFFVYFCWRRTDSNGEYNESIWKRRDENPLWIWRAEPIDKRGQ